MCILHSPLGWSYLKYKSILKWPLNLGLDHNTKILISSINMIKVEYLT